MSVDATKWAWGLTIPPSRKIVLLSMADRAGETHQCWPSVARLEADTCLDRKTILAAISDLESMGLVSVSRVLGQGNCYQLLGDFARETSAKNGTGTSAKNGTGTSAKNGTGEPVPKTVPVPILVPVPKTEPPQYQKRDTHQSQKRDTESPIEPKGTQKGESAPAEITISDQPTTATMAGAICVALKSVGMQAVNPSHPTLKSLIDSGADIGIFVEAGRECVNSGKGFQYLLAKVKGQISDSEKVASKAFAKRGDDDWTRSAM